VDPMCTATAWRPGRGVQALSYKSIKSILTHGLENQPLPPTTTAHAPMRHTHIRGARYYAQEGSRSRGCGAVAQDASAGWASTLALPNARDSCCHRPTPPITTPRGSS
jgi:hypothetical protein